jgi:mono/diheme cytochrome c family protein
MKALWALLGVGVAVLASWSVRAETLLERGTYLMRGIVACGNCHTQQTPDGPLPGMELAGGLKIDEPPFTLYTPNITPDRTTGIGGWSDQEIIAAIREGRRPDGSIIGPPMPIALYRRLSDRDAAAIVAYMRTVKPVSNQVAKSEYRIPLPTSYGPPVGSLAETPRSDPTAYGAYLAGPAGHCIECHSTPGPNSVPDFVNNLGAGGVEFHGPWGVSVSANITPSGLGDLTDAEIKTMITTGIRPDGSPMLPPMAFAYYKNISSQDLDAIVTYLRTIEPK